MTRMRAVLLACLVALVAVWVAKTATLPYRTGSAESTPVTTEPRDPGPLDSLDLEGAAMRLRARVDAAARPNPPARNPFRFGAEPVVRRSPQPQSPVAEVAPVPNVAPTAPPLVLVGLAEQSVDGASVRTAVMSMAQTLYYVKAGDRVGSAYEVVAVEADAVEVKDLVSGATRTIRLP